jgi:hypothetical protein
MRGVAACTDGHRWMFRRRRQAYRHLGAPRLNHFSGCIGPEVEWLLLECRIGEADNRRVWNHGCAGDRIMQLCAENGCLILQSRGWG